VIVHGPFYRPIICRSSSKTGRRSVQETTPVGYRIDPVTLSHPGSASSMASFSHLPQICAGRFSGFLSNQSSFTRKSPKAGTRHKAWVSRGAVCGAMFFFFSVSSVRQSCDKVAFEGGKVLRIVFGFSANVTKQYFDMALSHKDILIFQIEKNMSAHFRKVFDQ